MDKIRLYGWSGPREFTVEAKALADDLLRESANLGLDVDPDPFGADFDEYGNLPDLLIRDTELGEKGAETVEQIALAVVIFTGTTAGQWVIEKVLDKLLERTRRTLGRLRTAVAGRQPTAPVVVVVQIYNADTRALVDVRVDLREAKADDLAVLVRARLAEAAGHSDEAT